MEAASFTVRREKIPEDVVAGKPLGRHIEHDSRSRDYAVRGIHADPFKSVSWERFGGPFNQGDIGSCTGNAAAGACNTTPLHALIKRVLTEADALKLYEVATLLDDSPGSYPPTDTGSSGLAAAKAAKKAGLISGYQHAFTMVQVLTALQRGPVIVGVPWYEGFDSPNAAGLVSIAGQVRGGHEFEIAGYDVVRSQFQAWNSWGGSYGEGGKFYFSQNTLATLLEQDGDCTVLQPLGAK